MLGGIVKKLILAFAKQSPNALHIYHAFGVSSHIMKLIRKKHTHIQIEISKNKKASLYVKASLYLNYSHL